MHATAWHFTYIWDSISLLQNGGLQLNFLLPGLCELTAVYVMHIQPRSCIFGGDSPGTHIGLEEVELGAAAGWILLCLVRCEQHYYTMGPFCQQEH